MYKLFAITILTSFSIIRLCAQDDFESEMRNHPYFINNQNKIKDSFYQHTCKGAPYIVLSDIDNLVIPGLFLSKLSSIINTDNCYIEIDSLVAYPIPRVEYEQNKYYNFMDICKDEKLLDDIYIWFDVQFINYVEATIYIDYSGIRKQEVVERVITNDTELSIIFNSGLQITFVKEGDEENPRDFGAATVL